jgi:hypothetical protein
MSIVDFNNFISYAMGLGGSMLEFAEARGLLIYLKTSYLSEEEAAEHRKNLRDDLEALDNDILNDYSKPT